MSTIEKILVVDDSSTVHKMMKRHLEPEGYQICAYAKNGKEAVNLYQEQKPDLIFMDITMPVMDGIGALKEIKKDEASPPVVMLSAMGDDELVNEAYQLGATMYLQKPFKKDQLIEAIQKIQGGL